MRFALLGADAETLQLTDAAVASGHAIVWQGDLAAAQASRWLAEDAGERWEDLFDSAAADAVIIGRGPQGNDLRARQVQELVRLGRPLLVVHPLFPSVLTYFEVDMARGESGAVVQHFNPLTLSKSLTDMTHWTRDGHPRLGPIEQIGCTRSLADRSRENVLRHFARDVELLGRAAGRLDRIGAHAGPDESAAYAALSVQLTGERGIPVRWTVEPPTGEQEMRLSLVFRRGRVTIVFDACDRSVESIEQSGDQTRQQPLEDVDATAVAIDRFAAAAAAGRPEDATWPAALHAMELADSIEISLRRGRMIDVHSPQLTEHLAFKGTMAAAGCGVLLVLVPVMTILAMIAGQIFNVPVANFMPHLLLALLAAFLVLQLLPKLLYPPAAEQGEPADDCEETGRQG